MKNNKKFIKIIGLASVSVIALIWLASAMGAANSKYPANRNYNIRHDMSIPAHQSDTVKVMHSYEKLMDRYIDTVQDNLVEIEKESETIVTKLDGIEKKIDDLGVRLARIEKALNITEDIPAPPKPQPEEDVSN